MKAAKYVGVSFSDHHSLVIKFSLPVSFSSILLPETQHTYKADPQVVKDPVFKKRLQDSFKGWSAVKENVGFMIWWETIVKPGIRKLLIQRGKEMKRERRGKLNLLLVRQAYLVKKLQMGLLDKIKEHHQVKLQINAWYEEENRKVKVQSRVKEVNTSEKVSIFHHELHQKHIKRSAILKLTTENRTLTGHSECSEYLEENV